MKINDSVEYIDYLSVSDLSCNTCIYSFPSQSHPICHNSFSSTCSSGKWLVVRDNCTNAASSFTYSECVELLYGYYRRETSYKDFIMKLVKMIVLEK